MSYRSRMDDYDVILQRHFETACTTFGQMLGTALTMIAILVGLGLAALLALAVLIWAFRTVTG